MTLSLPPSVRCRQQLSAEINLISSTLEACTSTCNEYSTLKGEVRKEQGLQVQPRHSYQAGGKPALLLKSTLIAPLRGVLSGLSEKISESSACTQTHAVKIRQSRKKDKESVINSTLQIMTKCRLQSVFSVFRTQNHHSHCIEFKL